MFPFRRTSGLWERDVLALSVVPVIPQGSSPDDASRDASWLIRHDARIGAIGMANGILAGDGQEIRLRLVDVMHLTIPIRGSPCPAAVSKAEEQEAVLLHGFADQISRLEKPLIVTVGGRAMDLPFVRYRAFAKEIPLSGLHTWLNGRLNVFDRFDMNWHIDLADLLSATGASPPLTFPELCVLAGLSRSTTDENVAADIEALRVFAIFVRSLRIFGMLSHHEYRGAEQTLESYKRSRSAQAL